MLDASNTQILRDTLIAQCAAAGGGLGLPIHTLRHGARCAGFAVDDAELLRHLDFLTKDGVLSVSGSAVAAALKRWEITAKGTRYAEENNLV